MPSSLDYLGRSWGVKTRKVWCGVVQCGRRQGNAQQMRTRCEQRTETFGAVRAEDKNFLPATSLVQNRDGRGEHGQDQVWISCRILAIFSDQDWIWIFIFEKKWITTGSGYWFDFYNEIFLKVIQSVTNNRGSVFFTMFFLFIVSMCCTHHNQW